MTALLIRAISRETVLQQRAAGVSQAHHAVAGASPSLYYNIVVHTSIIASHLFVSWHASDCGRARPWHGHVG